MFNSNITLKIDNEIWEEIREQYRGKNAESIFKKIIRQKKLSRSLKNEKRMLERTLETNLRELNKINESMNEMKERVDGLEEEARALRRERNHYKKELEELRRNPIIEEKIVYKTDVKCINELKEKKDRLQNDLWRVRQEMDTLQKERQEIERRSNKLQTLLRFWMDRNHALLIQGGPETSTEELKRVKIDVMGSKEYYQYRTNAERFKKRYNVHGPCVVKLIEYKEDGKVPFK